MRKSHTFYIERWQIVDILLVIYDVFATFIASFLALWLRNDFKFAEILPKHLYVFSKMLIPYAILCVIVFWLFKLYKIMWRFVSYTELFRTFIANALCGIWYFDVCLVLCFSI